MKLSLFFSLLAALLAPPAHAGEFSLSYGSWNYDISGSADSNGSRLDFESDLGVRAREKSVYLASWDTAPGWWPDLAASYTPIRADGRKVFTRDTTFGGVVLQRNTSTAFADADLTDLDLTLRYPARLGSATVHGGVTVKRLNGEIRVKDESDAEENREPIDQTFPMAHLGFGLPLAEWLKLDAAANYVTYHGDQAFDGRVQAILILGPFSLNAGWQRKAYKVHSNRYLLDAELSGGFAGIGLLIR